MKGYTQRIWLQAGQSTLLLIDAFVLDFLCIHPFADGNGRLARLLTLLLLYVAGYEVGRYISLECIIEGTKETYYEALLRSSQRRESGNHVRYRDENAAHAGPQSPSHA